MDIKEIVAGIGSSDALGEAAAKCGVSPDQAQSVLHGVLDHVAEGGATGDGVVESLAARAGIDPAQVQQFLPHIMPLLQGHAENASDGVQGVLGGLMGQVGGMLGGAEGQSGAAGGLLGLAKGLFGQKS